MFGTIYSKAVELFGKSLLISAFIPTLIVTGGLAAVLYTAELVRMLSEWIRKDIGEQVSGALLVLLFLYLLAFVIFGIRDRITRFVSAGEFWALPWLRRRRRIHFAQRVLEAKEEENSAALAVAKATIWGMFGFDFEQLNRNDVYLPKGTKANRVFRKLSRWRAALAREQRAGKLTQELSAARRLELSTLFVTLHRCAAFDVERTRLAVAHLKQLCAAASPPIDIASWCKQVQQVDYADIVEVLDRNLWAPPLRYVQPTALGNILIWASVYSVQRYGIELDFLYPRLQRVIDKDYQAKIDDRQQFFDFSVLLTFLTFAAGIVYSAVAVYRLTTERQWTQWRQVAAAAAIAGAWFVVGRVAYKLSLVAARGYVSMVTSAIDLFRLPLLKQLEIKAPAEPWQEPDIWSELNVSIQHGTRPAGPA
jgi:hypothetical protein